ncbi:putative antibiotic efflux permease, MFS-type [Corynebacterium glutamicum MB001]|nr:putative antibiotic efflux permease, MFS-type [Corynebacterium glutamicum MB001]ARV63856.1 MFS transporter [Corynebacterium glutamicum]CAF20434.1 Permease of the major facilitator superfamily [Corynebacterium glutamicum ATCC 13032]CCH25237.1 permease of the major facilitator superfamily [Corynebacterium glutamicum K051]ASW14483.1 putative antibiotic efflux permease, MFS-type [Corynebacterium glutamicum]
MESRALTRADIEQLPSMWKSPGFVAVLVAVAAAFGSWSLLLPVVPLAVLNNGGSSAVAGATTGIFMAATVITQIFTPAALRKIGYTPVMAFAAFMLGVPAIGYIFSVEPIPVLVVSALRGIGFGALTVAESALVAELVPVRFLGKASGMLGVFIGLSQMLFLPAGLALGDQFGYNVVYVLGAVIALVAAVMCLRIPQVKAAAKQQPQVSEQERSVSTWKLVLVPSLAVTSLSMTFGAVSSFLPAAVIELDPGLGAALAGIILSITGGSSMVFRYLSGVIADRRGVPGTTMIPAQIIGFLGVVLITVTIFQGWSVWLLIIGAVMFGGAFGMVQNEALLSMFFRLPRTRVSEASAIWNIAFDSGTGIGSFLLGIVAASLAYSGAFGSGAVVILFGIVLTTADRIIGRHRITEYNNTRARLRQVPVARRAVQGLRNRRKDR